MTFFLMFVIMAVATDTRAVGEAAAIAVGGTVGLDAMFGGPISGASMNPARSRARRSSAATCTRSGSTSSRRSSAPRSPPSPTSSSATNQPEPRTGLPHANQNATSCVMRSSSEPSPHRRGKRRRHQRCPARPRARSDMRGRRRSRGRLPELLDLRHPVLRLRGGAAAAGPGPPHRRRPRGERDATAPQHGRTPDRRRAP